MAERTLPHNLEAEKSVLGAILINNQAFNQAAEVIDAQDFFRDAHRRIFEKMVGLTDRLVPGSVMLFDELSDWFPGGGRYTKWREGEWRALTEWCAETGRAVRPCLRGPRFSAAVEVV